MKNVSYAAAALSAAIMSCAPAGASTVTLVVPGTANPYLAGLPAGTTASSGDSAPSNSPVLVTGLEVLGGAAFSFSATGRVSLGGALGPDPDGSAPINHTGTPENGFSDVTMPRLSLLGVFLDEMLPTATSAPASLDFSSEASQSYSSLSPLLKQIFFIGDGVTDGGIAQTVVAPSGATRLYLGAMDGFGWFNNSGQFNVAVSGPDISTSPIPLPAGAPLLLAGLAALGALRGRKRGRFTGSNG
ncbi:VPLPA-CTERM sorting domain-containing protein [Roseovarius sp. D22-M7]|uniref:VPLPA-CTERM sorting domain-containing protein n=1 Tax=Roseovarius sp. D22-M7 TaxID=3127116 RepID=UPI0030102967